MSSCRRAARRGQLCPSACAQSFEALGSVWGVCDTRAVPTSPLRPLARLPARNGQSVSCAEKLAHPWEKRVFSKSLCLHIIKLNTTKHPSRGGAFWKVLKSHGHIYSTRKVRVKLLITDLVIYVPPQILPLTFPDA